MQATTIKQHVTATEEGFTLCINVSDTLGIANVTSIVMCVATDADGSDGDLAVNYTTTANNTGGGDMGMLLMRGWDDEMGKVMANFYSERAYTAQLAAHLQAAGFSAVAVQDVSGSEWGMQDEGRASYDAYSIANEVRKAMTV